MHSFSLCRCEDGGCTGSGSLCALSCAFLCDFLIFKLFHLSHCSWRMTPLFWNFYVWVCNMCTFRELHTRSQTPVEEGQEHPGFVPGFLYLCSVQQDKGWGEWAAGIAYSVTTKMIAVSFWRLIWESTCLPLKWHLTSPSKSETFVLSSDAENLEILTFCDIYSKSRLYLRMCTVITY